MSFSHSIYANPSQVWLFGPFIRRLQGNEKYPDLTFNLYMTTFLQVYLIISYTLKTATKIKHSHLPLFIRAFIVLHLFHSGQFLLWKAHITVSSPAVTLVSFFTRLAMRAIRNSQMHFII